MADPRSNASISNEPNQAVNRVLSKSYLGQEWLDLVKFRLRGIIAGIGGDLPVQINLHMRQSL